MSAPPPLDLVRAELARDLDGILAVDAATFDRPWTRAMYEWEWTHSDVARFYVARIPGAGSGAGPGAGSGAVVAYCAGWIVFDELHINNLAVDPAWRRCGIASALLTFVLEQAAAEGAGRVIVTGDGVPRTEAILRACFGDEAALREPAPLAGTLAALAAAHADAATRPHAVMPIYVRRPDAELARDRAAVRPTA